MFNLCNYRKGNGVDFWDCFKLFWLLVNFRRTIRAMYVYFAVYALFSCLCLV
jgi:hypothetical protein